MSFKIICVVIVSLAVPASLARAAPESSVITNAVAICKTNPACSFQRSDGGSTVFKVKKSAQSKYVLCKQNGTCETLMPKGQKSKVPDVAAFLAAN